MNSGVYKITNEVTGKFYIGSTNDIEKRWYDHKRYLRLRSHRNPKLQHSWDYYGEDKFTFMILEEVEPDQQKLFEREQYYLDTFKPYVRGIGYNISPTASGGDNITHNPNKDAFIEKMSEICSGEGNPMFGRKHSEETIKKQKAMAEGRFSLAWFIKRYGEETGRQKYDERRVMLKRRKINYSYPSSTKGKSVGPMSEESKQRISETKLKMRTLKPLIIQDLQTGLYTTKFIAEKYGVGMNVVKYCKKNLKETIA